MAFEIVYNNALKIYSQLYVGVRQEPPAPDAEDQVVKTPLAFATPYETNAAGLKRQGSVQSWLGTGYYDYKTREHVKVEPDIRIVDNKPRAGFKITDDIKRVYYGGGNVVWRLEDPLGWEIEIQSSNLMALIQAVGINANGEVPGECIIARDGAHNVLLPVSSEEYKNSIKAAESAKGPGKIPMKDRVIGRTYRLQDGTYGTYMGKMWVTANQYDDSYYGQTATIGIAHPFKSGTCVVIEGTTNGKSFNRDAELLEAVFVSEYDTYPGKSYNYKSGKRTKFYKSAPLIAELDQGEAISLQEAVDLVNTSEMVFAGSKSGYPVRVDIENGAKLKWAIKPCSEEDFEKQKTTLLEKFKNDLEYWNAHGQYSSRWPKPRLNVGMLTGDYRTQLIYLEGDQMYQGAHVVDLNAIRPYHMYGYRQPEPPEFVPFLGVVEFHKNGYRNFEIRQHNAQCSLAELGRISVGAMSIVPEQYDSAEEFEAKLNELFKAGRFVQKYITTKE